MIIYKLNLHRAFKNNTPDFVKILLSDEAEIQSLFTLETKPVSLLMQSKQTNTDGRIAAMTSRPPPHPRQL